MTKMKTKTLFYMALTAVMTTLAACSQDDDLQQDAAPEATPIEFEITDGGYGGDETTRAKEEGYYTKFTAGDECGLYIVNGSTLESTNVKLTLTASGENSESSELTWKTESPIDINHNVDYSCFLYYPYQQDMTGKFDVDKTADDTDFFDNLISGWEVKPNQSEHKDYTASDLMTAKGTATYDGTTLKLSFKLAHRMALAEIVAPVEVGFTSDSYKPYKVEDFKYRFIVNPGKMADGKYIRGYIGAKTFTIKADKLNALEKGQYKTFKVGSSYYVESTSEGTIYHVYNYNGLKTWAEKGEGCSCKLEADITMPELKDGETSNWTPAKVTPNGIFDGNGHTITGLRVNSTTENNAGFISINHGTVKNLTLKDANIKGKNYAGGVVGNNFGGKIENCHVTEDCSVYGDNAGGIVGDSNGGTVTGCYALCSLEGKDHCTLGGIIGYYGGSGSLTACYSKCSYTNGSITGGIVGNVVSGTPTFTACYYDNRDKGVGSGNGDDPTVKVDGTEGKTWADAVTDMNNALNAAGYTAYKYEIPAGGTLPVMVKN